jgi:hypothetical protein
MKDLSAEKLKIAVEANRKMIGRKVLIISENSYGIILDVPNEEEFIINIKGIQKRVSIFDIRAVE